MALFDGDTERVRKPSSNLNRTRLVKYTHGPLSNNERPGTSAGRRRQLKKNTGNNFKVKQVFRGRPNSVNTTTLDNSALKLNSERLNFQGLQLPQGEISKVLKMRTFKLGSTQKNMQSTIPTCIRPSSMKAGKLKEVTFELSAKEKEEESLISEMMKTDETQIQVTIHPELMEQRFSVWDKWSQTTPSETSKRRIRQLRCAHPRCNGSFEQQATISDKNSRRSSKSASRRSFKPPLPEKMIVERRSIGIDRRSGSLPKKSIQLSPRSSLKSFKAVQTEISVKTAKDAFCHAICVECEINKSMGRLPSHRLSISAKPKEYHHIQVNPTDDGNVNTITTENYDFPRIDPVEDGSQDLLIEHTEEENSIEIIPESVPVPPAKPLCAEIDLKRASQTAIHQHSLNLTLSCSEPSISLLQPHFSRKELKGIEKKNNAKAKPVGELQNPANSVDEKTLGNNEIKHLAFLSRINYKAREFGYRSRLSNKDSNLKDLYRQIEDQSYRSIDKMKIGSTYRFPDVSEMIYCLSRTLFDMIENKDQSMQRMNKNSGDINEAKQIKKSTYLSFLRNKEIGRNHCLMKDSERKKSLPYVPYLKMPKMIKQEAAELTQVGLSRKNSVHAKDGTSDAGNQKSYLKGLDIQEKAILKEGKAKKQGLAKEEEVKDGMLQTITSEILEDWKKGLEVISQKAIEEVDAKLVLSKSTQKKPLELGLSALQAGKTLIEKEMKELKSRTKFDQAFEDNKSELTGELPTLESIVDFISNVILSCKIIRQGIIISLVYLERLIENALVGLSKSNWRRLVLISLILGSKIWDDESFENHNFAKALPSFETKNIDTMERLFLEAIDYDVEVSTEQYTLYYFHLKRFAEEAKHKLTSRHHNPKTFGQITGREQRKNKVDLEHIKKKLRRNRSVDVIC